jgi:tRNA (cmo5U34)-methyltransferase
MADVEWNPDSYLDAMLAELPGFLELEERVAAATIEIDVRTVLELGVGTGETARRVLTLHPNARLTAIDASEPMLERARERLPGAELLLARLEDPLPTGPFDLVVSALAVHHLDRAGKRDLFERVHDVVVPGGCFVLGDVVVPEDPTDAQIEIDWVTDLPDRLDDQLLWLRGVGFSADPVWTWKDLAVVRAQRPPSSPLGARS